MTVTSATGVSERQQHRHEEGWWWNDLPRLPSHSKTCWCRGKKSSTTSIDHDDLHGDRRSCCVVGVTPTKTSTTSRWCRVLLLVALAIVVVFALTFYPGRGASSGASMEDDVGEQQQQEEQVGKTTPTTTIEGTPSNSGKVVMMTRLHDQEEDADRHQLLSRGASATYKIFLPTAARKRNQKLEDDHTSAAGAGGPATTNRSKRTTPGDLPPTDKAKEKKKIEPANLSTNQERKDDYHQEQQPSSLRLLPLILHSTSSSTTTNSNANNPTTTNMIMLVPNHDDDVEKDFFHEEGEDDEHHGGNRVLQQEGEDCVLSEETLFDVRILLALNSTSDCVGPAVDGTLVLLSENDKGRLEDTVVASYNNLTQRYCDPNFRNVSSAKIVRQGFSPSSQDGGSLTLEIQILGTLRCPRRQQSEQQGCIVDEIGLFDFPQDQQGNLQQPSASCLCPTKSSNDTTSIIASNRGPTEAEFMEYLGLRLATVVAPSLDCPDLQVAGCVFGTVFQSALAVTFPNPEAARNASALIGPLALRTLNDLYKNVSYAEFRVFQRVSVVFQGARRLELQETGDNSIPSSSPANVPESTTTSLVNDGSDAASSTNNTASSPPSESPTALFFDSTTLTAILYVDGVCSQCESDLFLSNDASARRRLGATFQDAMGGLTGRTMQEATDATTKSSCFFPIDSVVGQATLPAIEQFKTTMEERLQLEITQIQQVDREGMVVYGIFDSDIYRYPCSDIISTFKKNVTLELQVTCDAAPELSDEDKDRIGSAYVKAYNGLRAAVCDPFRLEVASAKVVETGDLVRGNNTNLPLMFEVTVVCYGCNPLETNVYGFPVFSMADGGSTAQINETRRYLYAPNNNMQTRREQEQGTCTCNSTLPRRAPLEADVMDALDLTLLQQEDLVATCLGSTSTCDFGTTFTTTALFEVQGDGTLEPPELAKILVLAFPNALNRLIGGGNATQCNSYFGVVTDTETYLEFVYNSVAKNVNETARRNLQNLPSVAPTSDLTFMYSWSASGANVSEAPTTAPTAVDAAAVSLLLDASGVCNGCPTELIFNDNMNARRLVDQNVSIEESGSDTMPEYRFLQEITGLEPESQCFCPIGSVQIDTDFTQSLFLQVIQEEVAKISNTTTVTAAVSGLTRVECVDETPFSTTINFAFSAFEWVVNNPDDIQGLGDALASIYNGLVEEFCDEYFRNSVSLTYVVGTLQRVSSQRHDRDLQNMQGCFNYRATFSVAGLCRGCQALGTPIPLFGNSTTTNRKLDEVKRQPSPLSRQQRRLQEAGSTCICDSTSISQRSAPSLGAIRAGLKALIPDALPWAQNPSICGLPVKVEIPCPIIPTGPSTTMVARFYARRFNDLCLTAADLLQIAAHFTAAFNARKQLERFPCEPQYLQVSNVIIDPSTLGSCRRALLRGGTNDDGEESHGGSSRHLRRDYSLMRVSMMITGNIYATNLASILAGEGTTLMAAAADVTERSGGIYEVYIGRATNSPSAMPSGFPSDFPSAFPSEFPTEDGPSTKPSHRPSKSPSDAPTTFGPTIKPSPIPSRSPSDDPTNNPSPRPSDNPTTTPSRSPRPSTEPTSKPSPIPSRSPSDDPTMKPSNIPSSLPSPEPTSKPSRSPSASPSTSKPTSFPSASPSTSQPSSRPSETPCPTDASSCTGKLDKVQKWCEKFIGTGEECCYAGDGTPSPCQWAGEATVFKKSCTGADSCKFALEPRPFIEVGAGSCIGHSACKMEGSASVQIGKNSCKGLSSSASCTGIASSKNGKTVKIGDNSCGSAFTSFSCSLIGRYNAETVVIGSGSCTGSNTCSALGQTLAQTVSIGDNSCLESTTCQNVGEAKATSITIGAKACTIYGSCQNVGQLEATSVSIGDEACTVSGSCQGLGGSQATKVEVSAFACDADCISPTTCSPFDPAAPVTCPDCTCLTV